MIKNSLTLFIIGILLNSCSTSTNTSKEVPKIVPNINVELDEKNLEVNIARGKSLYEASCSSCHQLYEKTAYDKVSWRKNVNAMYKRAKLNDLDKEFVYLYLTN